MTRGASDVVVVGAGIVGASVARHLAEAGARVSIVEEHRPAGGTSLATFAWVNAVGKSPRAYFDLNLDGIAEHRALVDRLGGGAWYHAGGNLEWSPDADALAAKVDGLRDWGYAVELVDVREARTLEPDLLVEDGPLALYPDDAWVDPVLLVARLLEHPGIRLVPAAARSIAVAGGRVVGVEVGAATPIACDVVVVCTGPRGAELLGGLDFELPMQHAPGLLAFTEPVPVRLGRIIHVPRLAARPDGGGRILLASDGLDRELVPSNGALAPETAAEELLDRARATLRGLRGARIETTRIGRRALPGDGKPAVGAVPGIAGAFAAVMHSGVTLAPLVGRLLAARVNGDELDPRLTPYALERFTAASPA